MKPARITKTIADPAHPDFLLEYSPFYVLTQVHGHYTMVMEHAFKAIGMNLPRWRVLMVLHEKNPSTVSEISRRSMMKLSTMTKVAQRLEKEGYVSTAPNKKDGRSTDVHLLDKGEQTIEVIRQVASKVYRRSTEEMDDDEINHLTESLRKLYSALITQP